MVLAAKCLKPARHVHVRILILVCQIADEIGPWIINSREMVTYS